MNKIFKDIEFTYKHYANFKCSPLFLALCHTSYADELVILKDKQRIETIHVVAQKRTENIQEVPISITVVTPSNIESNGYRQLTDIAEFVPNMRMSTTNDFTSIISLRGVGVPSRNIGFDSRVGLYLDGVYLGQSPVNNQDIFDLERIEVLRGPQGTLFGKNNVAGAVQLISKKPDEEFSGRVGLGLGNKNLQHITAVVNTPVNDSLRMKVSANKYSRDGLTENISTGNYINEQNNSSFRLQVTGEVNDKLSFHFSADQLHSDRLSFDGEPITDTLGRLPNIESPKRNKVSFDIDPHEKRKISGEILTIDWTLGNDFLIKSITGHRKSNIKYVNDFDFSQQSYAYFNYFDDYSQFSQEVQLISPENKFQYVAGLYYYQQNAFTARQSTVQEDAITLFTGVDRALVEYGASLGDPRSKGLLAAFNPGELTAKGSVDTHNVALFFNSNYQLSDNVRIDLGFRYTDEKKEVDWGISSLEQGTGIPIIPALALANGEVKASNSFHDLSPLVSFNYQLNKDINAYVKYATGYKSGGFNVDFLTQDQLDAGIEFDKETVETFELGMKGYAFEQRLLFRAAIFSSQYNDFQISQLVKLESGATALSIRNAAQVDTKGLELETAFSFNHWEFFASVGVLDGIFDSFKNGGTNGEDLTGNTLPEVSDYTYNLGFKYNDYLAFISSDFQLSMNYHYIDDYNSDLDGETKISLQDGSDLNVGAIDGYGITNLNIAITPKDTNLVFTFWFKNLFDENTPILLGKKSFFGSRRNVFVEPRMIGLTAQYNF